MVGSSAGHVVLKVGSCAAGRREPGQVRKEAALSGSSRVPQGCLTGAVEPGTRRLSEFDGGVHDHHPPSHAALIESSSAPGNLGERTDVLSVERSRSQPHGQRHPGTPNR